MPTSTYIITFKPSTVIPVSHIFWLTSATSCTCGNPHAIFNKATRLPRSEVNCDVSVRLADGNLVHVHLAPTDYHGEPNLPVDIQMEGTNQGNIADISAKLNVSAITRHETALKISHATQEHLQDPPLLKSNPSTTTAIGRSNTTIYFSYSQESQSRTVSTTIASGVPYTPTADGNSSSKSSNTDPAAPRMDPGVPAFQSLRMPQQDGTGP
ncbi:hypothetical protein BDZ91DRAFT_830087 [Kalaharituber pfeilii]|nr:hypothetical protein BDZ91DRAFT_830087 [Kalaharituber pfeilii]